MNPQPKEANESPLDARNGAVEGCGCFYCHLLRIEIWKATNDVLRIYTPLEENDE